VTETDMPSSPFLTLFFNSILEGCRFVIFHFIILLTHISYFSFLWHFFPSHLSIMKSTFARWSRWGKEKKKESKWIEIQGRFEIAFGNAKIKQTKLSIKCCLKAKYFLFLFPTFKLFFPFAEFSISWCSQNKHKEIQVFHSILEREGERYTTLMNSSEDFFPFTPNAWYKISKKLFRNFFPCANVKKNFRF
jgi:hypothetical protein